VMGSTGNTGATDATLVMAKKEEYVIKPHLELGRWELLEESAEDHLMSQDRKAVINVLRRGENKLMSVSELAAGLGKSELKEKNALRKLIYKMKHADILESIGTGRNSKYKLADDYYRDTNRNQGNEKTPTDMEPLPCDTEGGTNQNTVTARFQTLSLPPSPHRRWARLVTIRST